MEESLYWEPNCHSPVQDTPCPLFSLIVRCRIQSDCPWLLRQMKAYYIYIRSMFNIPPIYKRMYQVAPYIRDSQLKFLILVSSFSCVIYALSQSCSYSKALPFHFHINVGLTKTGLSGVSNFLFSCTNLLLLLFVEWVVNWIYFIFWVMTMFSLVMGYQRFATKYSILPPM